MRFEVFFVAGIFLIPGGRFGRTKIVSSERKSISPKDSATILPTSVNEVGGSVLPGYPDQLLHAFIEKRSSHSGLWERISDGKDFTPIMPKKQTIERARRDEREGKAASTQAGEFVREEIDEIRAGKHGARSTKQAIAIGLSKARRAGVKLLPPEKGKTSEATRRKAQRDLEKAGSGEKPSRRRSQATIKALKRERTDAASPEALSQQAHKATGKR
jgi:hypothetical protein